MKLVLSGEYRSRLYTECCSLEVNWDAERCPKCSEVIKEEPCRRFRFALIRAQNGTYAKGEPRERYLEDYRKHKEGKR